MHPQSSQKVAMWTTPPLGLSCSAGFAFLAAASSNSAMISAGVCGRLAAFGALAKSPAAAWPVEGLPAGVGRFDEGALGTRVLSPGK